MKKILFIVLALILIGIASIYFFIPNKITIRRSMVVEANKSALYRKLAENQSWKEWWPGENSQSDLTLNGISFKQGATEVLSFPLAITADGLNASTELTLIPGQPDSTTVYLETQVSTSYNPFKRVSTYFTAKKIFKSFSDILLAINKTYSTTRNLYGYDIQKDFVVDSNLVFTSLEARGNPDISSIYTLIDELKEYIKKQTGKETGFPMLSIETKDSIDYLIKVAIPVNKPLTSSGKFSYKWMLGGGNILITEVKGGYYELRKAHQRIMQYIVDHQRVAPAMPFESLVTDRRLEPDTSKWVTRLYYPVM